jgi:hypothetical protein
MSNLLIGNCEASVLDSLTLKYRRCSNYNSEMIDEKLFCHFHATLIKKTQLEKYNKNMNESLNILKPFQNRN